MNQPGGEPDLAALREEIREAGRSTRNTRVGCWLAVVFPAAVWSALVAWSFRDFGVNWRGMATFFADAALWGLYIALPGAAFYRRLLGATLRRPLAALSPEQQAEVLLPLESDPQGDTRQIAESLLREFGLPTELTPAASPEGSGTEVAALGK